MSALIGKKVGGALYLHKSALFCTSPENREAVKKAREITGIGSDDFNVVKLQNDRVSFLLYEDFSTSAFPALLDAYSVDLSAKMVSRKTYRKSNNPPILHRKELLLEPNHPHIPEYRTLTEAAENAKLFDEPRKIGFKKQWYRRLRQVGLRVDGHRLVATAGNAEKGYGSRSQT